MSATKIKVVVRARDFLPEEQGRGYCNSRIDFDSDNKEVVMRQEQRRFAFDQLFEPGSTQEQVYEGCNIKYLVERAVDGYHSTVFAYGQTSSGKTFTLDGYNYTDGEPKPPHDARKLGMLPRAVKELFAKALQRKERTFAVSFSFMQVYNQRIFDLLNPAGTEAGLRIRWNRNDQFQVENLFVFECKSAEELLGHFDKGLKQRVTASHRLNQSSSRSHAIASIKVQSFESKNPASVLSSKLYFVDLAGSERIGQTGAEGRHAKQSIDINKSLFTLRLVINTLAESSKGAKKEFVPYRDSKLTSILKQSIGGNSYCLMIACINPNDAFLQQNLSTLTYATKTAFITNRPVRNEDPQSKLIAEMRRQISQLTAELSQATEHLRIMKSLEEESPPELALLEAPSPEHFSEHLIESIKLVRQLLKSNKELREQLQDKKRVVCEKDHQIYLLQKENEELREGRGREEGDIKRAWTRSRARGMSEQKQSRLPSGKKDSGKQRGWVTGSGFGVHIGGGTLQSFNSVEINQFYINETGMDSMPTNFNKPSTAQGERKGGRYRHALTAAGKRPETFTAVGGKRPDLANTYY